MVERLVGWEKDWFLMLNGAHTPYLDSVMYLISDKWPWIILGAAFLFLLFFKQKPREAIALLLAIGLLIFIGDQISSQLTKPFFQRCRPTHHPLTHDLVKTVLDYRGGHFGFISGHATNFFAFATFTSLLIRYRYYSILVFLTVITVAYSRLYLGVHFITDIIPGILVGLFIGWVVYRFYIRARELFLSIPPETSKTPYFEPQSRKKDLAILMAIFYICIWSLSPLIIQLY